MLDSFFITGQIPMAEHGSYSLPLVGLSFIVASLASYLALALARRLALPKEQYQHRSWVYIGGSLALGAGIWSMHFVGMLAFKMDMPMTYHTGLTLLSLAVAIASALGVLLIVGRERLTILQTIAGALVLGTGISAMHYIGMEAMIMPAEIRFQPSIFALSILIAVTASGAALWLCFKIARHSGRNRAALQGVAALIMGAAICGMHYTGMAAAVFLPHEHDHTMNAVSDNGASLIIAIIGIILCLVAPVTIYKEIKEDGDQDSASSSFPAKLLAISIFGSLATFMAVIGYALHNSHILRNGTAGNTADSFNYIAYGTAIAALVLIPAKYFSLYSVRVWRQELKSNKQLLDTILNNMPLGLFAKDVQLGYRWALLNKTAEAMLCLDHKTTVGRTDYDFFPKNEADFFRQTDENVMAEGKLVDIEAEPVTTSNGTFISHTIKVPIYDAEGKPRLLLGMMEDVTERMRAKEELRLAKERAEQSDQTKSEFLANMSHELRTPMNSILGMTRLLLSEAMPNDQKDTLKTIYQSSTQLLELVNDILDLSKIEANQVELEKFGFDPAYVVTSTTTVLQQIANEKRVKLAVKMESLPYLIGDPTRLSRIFINLIGNGIKYTDQGSVTVTAITKPIDENNTTLLFSVSDTGIGIPTEKLDVIFDKFVQADTSTTRRYGGTGLGLAITKQLTELMGGMIEVASTLGEGSVFTVSIPFPITTQLDERPSHKIKTMTQGTVPPVQAKILIAEDHAMNKIYIAKLMQKFGLSNFEIVENGVLAIEAYKRETWDVILMDCHMPEKNGYDTTEDIRKLEEQTGQHVPIVAMTANAMVGDREKCLRYGMDDYISKPINNDELKAILSQWIAFEAPAIVQEEPFPKTPHVDLSVLQGFTDDAAVLKELIAAFIQQSDVNIVSLEENCVEVKVRHGFEAAHMLKGGARMIGAEVLGALGEMAQSMSIATTAERRHLLDDIRSEYKMVCEELQTI